MKGLTLDLRPGTGLGAFNLGMPVCEALAFVDQHSSIFDVVHVKYNEEEPLSLDLVLSFPEYGFHLRFEPRSQRLRLIEVYDVQLLHMRYATSSIGGPHAPATFVAVYALFGPTFPGTFNLKRCIYHLNYPGLSFVFPIPPQHISYWQDRKGELPLEFPDGTTPVMSRACIYDSTGEVCGSFKLVPAPQLPGGGLYMEEVHAKPAEDIHFNGNGQRLAFGASPQDVWAQLGRPCCIQKKQIDPMVIHSASDPRPQTALCGDYFYNYFTRGLDILFDGQTHRIKKFILHTNFPGHTDFNCYMKCNFFIHCPPALDTGSEKKSLETVTNRCISSVSKWSEVQDILGDGGRAAIQTQGSDTNPFGPTFVYGYRDIALEVMKNGHIATVTLFQTGRSSCPAR
ncbi:hypothetical protein MPTK1_2g18070 [Marchantia polymorpha subsp. ruderalis]|uniref:Uncharacterized protein n=1 Tax=Marchantia polymorpha TaxID=3197 RepID=A0A2R6WGC7_MARPO|nr:hypothetical protein MARPO_0094s0075 [Marchantia polymorpha]BBN02781.1 hypothetical protein Mp_2g18070 [Marchantia polymorpha subsp. ruderalis]|eukprot:PTQ32908.1 hypothetical protein MARPO_0094s0075 [Marchantia polymorpha]